jgi:hypothetical protein
MAVLERYRKAVQPGLARLAELLPPECTALQSLSHSD